MRILSSQYGGRKNGKIHEKKSKRRDTDKKIEKNYKGPDECIREGGLPFGITQIAGGIVGSAAQASLVADLTDIHLFKYKLLKSWFDGLGFVLRGSGCCSGLAVLNSYNEAAESRGLTNAFFGCSLGP
jgi:hypothetical protein